jgi:putative endonuclease
VPWDVEWEPHYGEKRFDLPAKGRQNRGRLAEDAVARHLWLRGYRLLGRNVRNRRGEIDIVAEGAGRLRFIEVRSYTEGHAQPSAHLTRAKRLSILHATQRYVARRPEFADASRILELAEVRFNAAGRVVDINFIAIDVGPLHR